MTYYSGCGTPPSERAGNHLKKNMIVLQLSSHLPRIKVKFNSCFGVDH
jgi:hypothetical protein